MAANEDSARPLAAPVVLGEDLSRLSEQELAERIALLHRYDQLRADRADRA